MKKFKIFAYAGAIALLSVFGFSACSSNDDVLGQDPNPNNNSAADKIHVNFVFNVSTSNEPTMRMSSADTQASLSEAFRGITNAYLGTLTLGDDGKTVASPVSADTLYNLGTVIAPGKLDPTLETATSDITKSHRILQLSLKSGTNSLLFWGKAVKTGTDLEQGRVDMKTAKSLSDVTFSLCKMVPQVPYEANSKNYWKVLTQYEKLIAEVLSEIVNCGVAGKEIEYGGTKKTITLNWKDYVIVSGGSGSYTLSKVTKSPANPDKAITLLGDRLSSSFVALNTIHSGELRAGYGEAVAYVISDLMTNVEQVINATPLSIEEVATQEVAKKIQETIEKYFEKNNGFGYKWRDVATVKTEAKQVLDNDKDLVDGDLNNFPADFKLPLGSVILGLNIEAQTGGGYKYTYGYLGSVDTYAMGGTAGSATTAFNPQNYMFPAELCYFGNSPIRVTEDTKVAADYPDGVAEWNNSENWSTWTNNSHVTTTSRSVAMRDNVNYGTALLKTTVRYGAQKLQDNNHNIQKRWNGTEEPNNQIDVTTRNDHFKLTGVLVGGQNPDVGWNYIAKSTTTGFGAMVYDRAKSTIGGTEVNYIEIPQASTATGGNPSKEMYTLLWDNWDQTVINQKQRDVYIALEFVNNSQSFYGENNAIRNGATFYIVGKLDPDKITAGLKKADNTDYTQAEYEADRSLGITWPTNYALPPYDASGNTIKQRRVFMQDYMTSATFVINETSLQHALVNVPDLRSGQISLGLSVDLNWQTGINFGEVILGE